MYRFYTALKDASIYSIQPNQNTGRDEILEISKTDIGGVKDIGRSLIKFDVNQISSASGSGEIKLESSVLILKETEHKEIPTEYSILAIPVEGSWDMGIGTKFDEISTEHVTWRNRKTDTPWTNNGGDYNETYTTTTQIEYMSTDLEINLDTPLDAWLSGSIPNEGLILKLSDSLENDSNDYGILQYFSKETNTIYQPKIRIGWDDQVFSTGTLPLIESSDIRITYKNLKTRYKVNSIPLIRVIVRDEYPLKTYTDTYGYDDEHYLPIDTYYQIRDSISNEIIIPFSEFSKVSCDEKGNFFRLDLHNWETNRSYFIEIKTIRDGVAEYYSEKKLTFRVEK